jgi:hypothetical protein
MLLVALALLGVAAVPAPPPRPAPVARPDRLELVARGDQSFAARGDPARLAEALEAWGQAAVEPPPDPAIDLRIARAEAFRAISDPASARAAWPSCSRAAERALRRLSPAWATAVDAGDLVGAPALAGAEAAEALYWLALATWSSAREKGLAALLAVKDPTLAAMERAAALDPAVDCGGPERALGAWAAALPTAAGGGVAASRRHLERARELGPGCLANRVAEAGSLLVLLQDRDAFDRALAAVDAAGEGDPRFGPENDVARRQAGELRAQAARLF